MRTIYFRILLLLLPAYWGIISNLHQLHKLPGFRQYNQSIFVEYERYQCGGIDECKP